MAQFYLNGKVFKGLAIDMDGTLIDCEAFNRMAVQNAAGKHNPIDWSKNAGKREAVIYDGLVTQYGPNSLGKTAEEFVAACKQGYADNINKLEARLGMEHLLQTLRDLKIPIYVVTNTEKDMATKKLTASGLIDYVDEVIGVDTVEEMGLKAKPSGDGYRLAAQRMGLHTDEVLAFEDSHAGMDAAVDAKVTAYHVTDYGTEPHQGAVAHLDGIGGADLIALSNKIRRENYQQFLGLTPEPRRPAYT